MICLTWATLQAQTKMCVLLALLFFFFVCMLMAEQLAANTTVELPFWLGLDLASVNDRSVFS